LDSQNRTHRGQASRHYRHPPMKHRSPKYPRALAVSEESIYWQT
jgi:hypothetical protein